MVLYNSCTCTQDQHCTECGYSLPPELHFAEEWAIELAAIELYEVGCWVLLGDLIRMTQLTDLLDYSLHFTTAVVRNQLSSATAIGALNSTKLSRYLVNWDSNGELKCAGDWFLESDYDLI